MEVIGAKVKNVRYGAGIIVAVRGEVIEVDFGGYVKTFALEGFNKFFTFENVDISALIGEMEQRIAAEREAVRLAAEAAKLAAKEAAARNQVIARYDADYHAEYMSTSTVFTYQEVQQRFGINIAGFGRGCNPTDNEVVLISSVDPENENFVYHDRWDNGEYIFSGEGRVGDQTMTRGNLAIKNAEEDNKQIHLFIKESAQEYYYQGVFVLVEYTYEDDIGADGNIRKEYKFRLRRV